MSLVILLHICMTWDVGLHHWNILEPAVLTTQSFPTNWFNQYFLHAKYRTLSVWHSTEGICFESRRRLQVQILMGLTLFFAYFFRNVHIYPQDLPWIRFFLMHKPTKREDKLVIIFFSTALVINSQMRISLTRINFNLPYEHLHGFSFAERERMLPRYNAT